MAKAQDKSRFEPDLNSPAGVADVWLQVRQMQIDAMKLNLWHLCIFVAMSGSGYHGFDDRAMAASRGSVDRLASRFIAQQMGMYKNDLHLLANKPWFKNQPHGVPEIDLTRNVLERFAAQHKGVSYARRQGIYGLYRAVGLVRVNYEMVSTTCHNFNVIFAGKDRQAVRDIVGPEATKRANKAILPSAAVRLKNHFSMWDGFMHELPSERKSW